VAALRFLYKVSLKKDWTFEDVIPAPKKPQKLPVVLSPEEVLQFLGCVGSIKHRAILTCPSPITRLMIISSPSAQLAEHHRRSYSVRKDYFSF
jgi:hypothetical protein